MNSPDGNYFNIDRRLTLTLALLIALILGGNGLVILQFERARLQTDRLTGVSQQLIAVLRLQEGLLSFHQRLSELAQAKDAPRLLAEIAPLRTAILEQARQTRSTLAYLPQEFLVDPAFLTALDAFGTTLPAQLRDITGLAGAGDWEAVRLRLENESRQMESTTANLVRNIDLKLDEELPRAVANMRDVQRRILIIVPATAILTVFIAAFFGWAIARRMLELRLEERLNERNRIARELHDTLLQSFQGVLMKFSGVGYLIRDRPAEAEKALEKVIGQAREAISEGRDAVQGLRSSTVISNDLARAIRTFGEQLATERSEQNCPEFRMLVDGEVRDLAPLVRDDAFRIACEALRNAFRHSEASRIEVEIQYARRHLRLRVLDNGKGIDQKALGGGAREGHFGLAGLHERAKVVGGKLAIRSRVDSGTEIDLIIPGSIAYAKSQVAAGQG
ncbi:MAG TPA: histidine kinase [Bryobacteraceae bacterium]|nr:histidine kinase [Bryobacteraceae bacterium]